MYKLFLLSLTIGGIVLAASWDNTSKSVEAYDRNNQYCLTEDTSIEDDKIEAGRRRGKGHKGRRRGGGGLR